jgi:hypothetical protein
MKTATFLILMLLPAVMMGQSTASANIYSTITTVDRIEPIQDSIDLHFRVRSDWNFLMNLSVTNVYGSSSTDIMTSPSTDLFLPGRRTPGLVIVFNYN